MVTRRGFMRGAAGAGAALTLPGLLTACGSSDATAGGTLRVGTSIQPRSFNPFSGDGTIYTVDLLYPRLLEVNYRPQRADDFYLANIPGAFATEVDRSEDGLTIAFTTRSGAKWSDGQPMTADDVVLTFRSILELGDGPLATVAGAVDGVTDVRSPDPGTVVFEYDRPIASAVKSLAGTYILPRHVWERYIASGKGRQIRGFEPGKDVVTSCPFRVGDYRRDQFLLLRRDPNWSQRRPAFDALGIRYYGTQESLIAALEQGEIDAVDRLGPTPAVNRLGAKGLEVLVTDGLQVAYLAFNSNPRKPRNRELLRRDVRSAIEHATDRDRIAQVAHSGFADPVATILAPSFGPYHNPNIERAPFDPERANAMLDAAGLRRGADGVRVAGDHPMRYRLLTSTGEAWANRQFEVIQEGLEQIGIEVEQRPMDDDALYEALLAPDGKYLEFDLNTWSTAISNFDPEYPMGELFATGTLGADNETGYSNPEFDRLFRAQVEAVDPEQRRRIVWRQEEIIARDKPFIPIVNLKVISAHQPAAWTGFVNTPDESNLATYACLLSVKPA